MASMEELREGVRECLPEVNLIEDEDLRHRVVEAWAFSLSKTEYTRIDQIPGAGHPGRPPLKKGTQADHTRVVALLVQGMADALEKIHGDMRIDRDLLLACALCHDVGKPYEFSPANNERWKSNVAAAGYPALRHTMYGAYVALSVGLPEAVAHTAAGHSKEGQFIKRSLENTLVHLADEVDWSSVDRADLLEWHRDEKGPGPA